jgi:hypothetical protein
MTTPTIPDDIELSPYYLIGCLSAVADHPDDNPDPRAAPRRINRRIAEWEQGRKATR